MSNVPLLFVGVGTASANKRTANTAVKEKNNIFNDYPIYFWTSENKNLNKNIGRNQQETGCVW